jgi:hypothetical protein
VRGRIELPAKAPRVHGRVSAQNDQHRLSIGEKENRLCDLRWIHLQEACGSLGSQSDRVGVGGSRDVKKLCSDSRRVGKGPHVGQA